MRFFPPTLQACPLSHGWPAILLCCGTCLLLWGCGATPQASRTGLTASGTIAQDSEARKRARIRLELAVAYFQQGKTDIALDELRQVLAVDPAFPEAHNLRGLIAMRLREFPTAEESFLKALSLRPGDANVLHNLGWLECQRAAYPQSFRYFGRALATPGYQERGKTWMTQGLCQISAGQHKEAESSLLHAYEFDATNPIVGYNLAHVLYLRKEYARAQFYIRRLNNSDWASAESLWLGIKIDKLLADDDAVAQLAQQLEKRFSQSAQADAYRRGAFDE
ncbi:type IV pilus biogenesis/stability protein PilW [Candidatus Symbiobacter mobilis]|uniref:Type IV pilus assembly protein PilF n=1 Tax=Candidatus Symbiobacter mobilis CR TaxID=946483 RepID=U5NCP5_9BURK|nr:type IV pilus biogenesis/stability protein PilW [Candidatus Symbiobacter mobilis]AGX87929.1 type IV pilus assembly protein PilF [Candidatus Symbiobacter mobilis CR]